MKKSLKKEEKLLGSCTSDMKSGSLKGSKINHLQDKLFKLENTARALSKNKGSFSKGMGSKLEEEVSKNHLHGLGSKKSSSCEKCSGKSSGRSSSLSKLSSKKPKTSLKKINIKSDKIRSKSESSCGCHSHSHSCPSSHEKPSNLGKNAFKSANKAAQQAIKKEVSKLHHMQKDAKKEKQNAQKEARKIVSDAKKTASAQQASDDTKVALASAQA